MFVNLVCSTVVCFQLSNPASTENPLRDFSDWRKWKIGDEGEIVWFATDLNSDGDIEVFVSESSLLNGKAGLMWRVYVEDDGMFRKQDYIPTLPTRIFIGQPDGLQKSGIYSYGPGDAESGTLVWTGFVDGEIRSEGVQELFFKDDTNELSTELFVNNKYEGIRRSSVQEIEAGIVRVPDSVEELRELLYEKRSQPSGESTSNEEQRVRQETAREYARPPIGVPLRRVRTNFPNSVLRLGSGYYFAYWVVFVEDWASWGWRRKRAVNSSTVV